MDTNRLMQLLPEMAVFVTVVDEGSFSKSAQRLGVAPSSVSRSITKLEDALGEKLLERTTRKMSLNPIGKEVYSQCRDMLLAAKHAVSAAQSQPGMVSGILRVAAPKALSRQVLMPMILGFMQNHPNVTLQLKVVDHYIDPVGDEVDVIIHITEKPTEGLVARTLGHSKLLLCATPAYLADNGEPTYPDEIGKHNCLCLGENPLDRVWRFSHGQKSLAVQVNGSLMVNHSEIRKEAVLAGMGISVFPEFAVQQELQQQSLVSVLPDWHISGNYQGIIIAQYPQSKYIPFQVTAFVNHLQAEFIKRKSQPV